MLIPEKITKDFLEDIVEDTLLRIKKGDSLEGFIEWSFIDDSLEENEVFVKCSIRRGNADGSQGSIFLMGKVVSEQKNKKENNYGT